LIPEAGGFNTRSRTSGGAPRGLREAAHHSLDLASEQVGEVRSESPGRFLGEENHSDVPALFGKGEQFARVFDLVFNGLDKEC